MCLLIPGLDILDENTMLGLGDCLELMQYIPDGSVDMCLTDPPYGTTACKWDNVIDFDLMWEQLKRIVKPNGAICLFGSEPFSSRLRLSNLKMFKYDWVWEKTKGAFANAKKRPLKRHEIISVFGNKINYYPVMEKREGRIRDRRKEGYVKNHKGVKNKNAVIHEKYDFSKDYDPSMAYPNDILKFNSERAGYLHPTQKPVALLEYLIKTYTLPGEIVLDFTMGSGSTGMACKNLGRKFIGIEKDEKYFEIAVKRIIG